MSKLANRVTAVLVLVFISAFALLTLIRRNGSVSYQENRQLAEAPGLSASALLDGSYTQSLSAAFTDHFAGRSLWTSANARLSPQISERIVNGVYIADDMLLDTGLAGLSKAELCANAVNSFAEGYEGSVCFAAIPSSSGVYSELLPEYLVSSTEEQQIDRLYDALAAGIRRIDAFNILNTLSDNYIYYRNDTKWTSYGAYCVYRTVIQKLGYQPTAYDKYTIEHVSGDFKGCLYNRSQYSSMKPDILDVYDYAAGAQVVSCTSTDNDGRTRDCTLYDKSLLDSSNEYGMYLGEPAPLVRIRTSVNNERRLLLIKDEYADCFVQFLIQHYSEIAIVSPEYMTRGLSSFVDVGDYEQTLFLFGIEDLGRTDMLDRINE